MTTPAKADDAATGQVVRWLLDGATERDIAAGIAEKWPDADSRPLIAAAMMEISASADADPSLVQAWCFEAARNIYRQALANGDFGAALRALKMVQESIR